MGKILDRVDRKALRFAVGFPVVLAGAFVFCASLLRRDLPEPLAIQWTDDGGAAFAPFGAYAGGGAALILAAGWLVLSQALPLGRPVVMRRIMMGVGLFLSLFVTTVLAAGLVGQAGVTDARELPRRPDSPGAGERSCRVAGCHARFRLQGRPALVRG